MDKKDKTLIGIAIVICVIICVLSPYIASGDPDGLEKSAEDSGLAEDFSIEEINGIPESVFPDYAFANDPDCNTIVRIWSRIRCKKQKLNNLISLFFFF